jgi:hypothetical protein
LFSVGVNSPTFTRIASLPILLISTALSQDNQ